MQGESLETAAARRIEDERRGAYSRVELRCTADIEPRPVEWLWENFLARGELHLLAGAPGSGKTTLSLEIASVVSRGGIWPDGTRAPAGDVLIWTGEDSPEHTLVPRLIAAGADRTRVHILHGVAMEERSRSFDPAIDLPLLHAQLGQSSCVNLIILDPIVSVINGDSHKNTEVRRNLQPVVDLAQQAGACVLGISHFTKGSIGRDVVERVTGSLAFAAVSRVVLVTVSGRGDPELRPRGLIRAKSNLGPDGGGFGYTVSPVALAEGISASRIAWQDPLMGSPGELMGQFEGQAPSKSKADELDGWLRSNLQGGPKPAADVVEQGASLGYTRKMIRGAAERLRIFHFREGFGRGSRIFWRLPEVG